MKYLSVHVVSVHGPRRQVLVFRVSRVVRAVRMPAEISRVGSDIVRVLYCTVHKFGQIATCANYIFMKCTGASTMLLAGKLLSDSY
jgi:hypothetical protein